MNIGENILLAARAKHYRIFECSADRDLEHRMWIKRKEVAEPMEEVRWNGMPGSRGWGDVLGLCVCYRFGDRNNMVILDTWWSERRRWWREPRGERARTSIRVHRAIRIAAACGLLRKLGSQTGLPAGIHRSGNLAHLISLEGIHAGNINRLHGIEVRGGEPLATHYELLELCDTDPLCRIRLEDATQDHVQLLRYGENLGQETSVLHEGTERGVLIRCPFPRIAATG